MKKIWVLPALEALDLTMTNEAIDPNAELDGEYVQSSTGNKFFLRGDCCS